MEIKLDLSNHNLVDIPEEVFKQTHLQELDLSNNFITEIPKEISSLKNLRRLILKNNPLLGEISKNLLELQELKYLDITSNYLGKKQIVELLKLKNTFRNSGLLSDRAERYLKTLNRIPEEIDQDRLSAITCENKILSDPVIDFQIKFGGYVQYHGYNFIEWGILFKNPEKYSYFAPNKTSVEKGYSTGVINNVIIGDLQIIIDEILIDDIYDDCIKYLVCANCHASDMWLIGMDGTLFYATPNNPVASSFEKYIERYAVIWELLPREKNITDIYFQTEYNDVLSTLLPRLEIGKITEASDEYVSVYYTNGVYLSFCENRKEIICCFEEGADLSIFDGVSYSNRQTSSSAQTRHKKKKDGFFKNLFKIGTP